MAKNGLILPEDFGSKIPPHSPEAEMAVIGSMMIEKDAIVKVTEYLEADNFYSEVNRILFTSIFWMYNKKIEVDIVTLSDRLVSTGLMEVVGGTAVLSDINRKTPSSANVEHYAMIVKERYLKRAVIRQAWVTLSEAYDDSTDAFEVIDNANARAQSLTENLCVHTIKTPRQLAEETYSRLLERQYGETFVLESPYKSLNYYTGGFLGGDLILIGGASGMGKTALIMGLIKHWGITKRLPLYVFSLEMSDTQLLYRQISAETEIGGNRLRIGKIKGYEDRIGKFLMDEYAESNIWIDDNAGMDIDVFCNKLKLLHKRQGFVCAIVDYIQLVAPSSSLRRESSARQVGDMSRKMKILARELDIPIFLVSQLKRELMNLKKDKRPVITDLKESGSLENDADFVIFPYRPYYYLPKDEKQVRIDKKEEIEMDAEVIIAKNRHYSDITLDKINIGHKQYTMAFDKKKILYTEIEESRYGSPPVDSYYEPKETEEPIF